MGFNSAFKGLKNIKWRPLFSECKVCCRHSNESIVWKKWQTYRNCIKVWR